MTVSVVNLPFDNPLLLCPLCNNLPYPIPNNGISVYSTELLPTFIMLKEYSSCQERQPCYYQAPCFASPWSIGCMNAGATEPLKKSDMLMTEQ